MSKKGVGFKEEVGVREIPHRKDVIDLVPMIDPATGQIVYIPLMEEYRRKHDTTTGEEFQAAASEFRQEGKKTSRERGYKLPNEARQMNKPKTYNPASGKWEGGKKKRKTHKRKFTKKRITRKRFA